MAEAYKETATRYVKVTTSYTHAREKRWGGGGRVDKDVIVKTMIGCGKGVKGTELRAW